MPIDLVIDYTEQILHGVDHIHCTGFIHRDIKPSNILLSDCQKQQNETRRIVKIADFGLTRAIPFPSKPMSKEIQTLNYRAPEVMLDNLNYTKAVDIWSVGVIVFEMLTGKKMFPACSEIEFIIQLLKMKGNPTKDSLKNYHRFTNLIKFEALLPQFSESTSPQKNKDKLAYGFAEFIDELTNIDPTKRPSAKEALSKLSKIREEFQNECFSSIEFDDF